MLPFSTINQYGNQITNWYTGTEVLAYDSKIYKNTAFTDYTGKTITSIQNVYGVAGVMPTIGTQTFQYGTGINLNRGSIGNIGLSPGYLSGSWCVDFWVAYTTIGNTNDFLPFYPLMNDNNATGGTLLEFQSNSGTKYFSVFQNSVFLKTATVYLNELRTPTYNHFAIQYNFSTKTLYLYINGVLKITFTSLNYTVPNTTYNGFIWGNYGTRSSSAACIERYRIRTGVYFSPTGFSPDDSTLYPGSPL